MTRAGGDANEDGDRDGDGDGGTWIGWGWRRQQLMSDEDGDSDRVGDSDGSGDGDRGKDGDAGNGSCGDYESEAVLTAAKVTCGGRL